jgi:hypothetical protein
LEIAQNCRFSKVIIDGKNLPFSALLSLNLGGFFTVDNDAYRTQHELT